MGYNSERNHKMLAAYEAGRTVEQPPIDVVDVEGRDLHPEKKQFAGLKLTIWMFSANNGLQ
jgi:hypothetical protein